MPMTRVSPSTNPSVRTTLRLDSRISIKEPSTSPMSWSVGTASSLAMYFGFLMSSDFSCSLNLVPSVASCLALASMMRVEEDGISNRLSKFKEASLVALPSKVFV